MQLGRAAHLTVLDVADHDDAIVKATGDIPLQEIIIDDAVEAIAPAGLVEPQKMVAQKWPLGPLQHPHGTCGRTREAT
jgi:spore coat polysaccharide biosynthesis protein SpsF (cytidylyltransferase family)